MREIKFRAWDIEKKIMVTQQLRSNWEVLREAQAYGWKLMQYANHKDKNGVEIYEGDICLASGEMGGFYYDDNEEPVDQAFVVEINPAAEYGLGTYFDLEVIGNIYEKPYLKPKL